MTSPTAPVMRVATYNIHQCVGSDKRYDVDRVAEVLRQVDARVVALQEVQVRLDSGREHPLDVLAEATGMAPVSGLVLFRADGPYGNALLTDLPVLRASDFISWTPHLIPGGLLLIHDIFPNPAEGGRAPWQIYSLALASGLFEERYLFKPLGALRRIPCGRVPAAVRKRAEEGGF